jgi:hypothetical protein
VVELELRATGEVSRVVVDGVEVLVSLRHGWFSRLKIGDAMPSTLLLGACSLPSAKKLSIHTASKNRSIHTILIWSCTDAHH